MLDVVDGLREEVSGGGSVRDEVGCAMRATSDEDHGRRDLLSALEGGATPRLASRSQIAPVSV